METCIQYSFAARLCGLQAEDSTRQLQGNRGELEFQLHRCLAGDTKSHDTKSHDGTFTSPEAGRLAGSNYRMGFGDL